MISALAIWFGASVLVGLAAGRFIRTGMVDLKPHTQTTEEVGP